MNYKGVENLCNAIILSAVNDYRKARCGERVAGKEPGWVIADCERFFLSDWFAMLTNLDGEMLLEKLRKE